MAAKPQTTAFAQQTVLPEWYSNYAQEILANQRAVANRPYTPYTEPRIADLTPDQLDAFEATRGAAGAYQGPLALGTLATAGTLGRASLDAADPLLDQATAIDAMDAASPYLSEATSRSYGMDYAKPYLDMAAGNVTNVEEYFNPYVQHVLDRFSDLGARTLREKLMPELMSKYLSAGQLGFGGTPTGLVTDSARALRDVHETVNSQYLAALSDAYNQSRQAKLADLERYAGLGETAAGIGTAQTQAYISAAQTAAQAEIARQQALTEAAQLRADASARDTQNQLLAGAQLGALGAQSQQLGLAGAGALNAIGGQQQQQNQQNLSLQYQDYLNQQNYPQQQVTQTAQTLGAVNPAVPQGQVGYQQQIPTSQAPSTTQTVLSGLAAIKALGS